MKVTTQVFGPNDDGRDALRICVDREVLFEIASGEPEDFSVRRDLKVCLDIPELMGLSYFAGTRNEPFDIEILPPQDWDQLHP